MSNISDIVTVLNDLTTIITGSISAIKSGSKLQEFEEVLRILFGAVKDFEDFKAALPEMKNVGASDLPALLSAVDTCLQTIVAAIKA